MTFTFFKKYITPALESIYSPEEIHSIAQYLADFYTNKKTTLLDEILFDENDLNTKLNALNQNQPIQQVVGFAYFGDSIYFVNEDVLIPRPETFELVEKVNELLKQNSNSKIPKKILDIGTGSGCIAIELAKKNKLAIIQAIDVSEKALDIAHKNKLYHNVNIDLKLQDIFSWDETNLNYDVIISNPPYIGTSEAESMSKTVLEFEPHIALFSPNDVLTFYKKITSFAKLNLQENGLLFFEIHADKKNEVLNILEKNHFQNIECFKDFYGNDRIIKGEFKK